MKTRLILALAVMAFGGIVEAQDMGGVQVGPPHPGKGAHVMMFRHEMGKWWHWFRRPAVRTKPGATQSGFL